MKYNIKYPAWAIAVLSLLQLNAARSFVILPRPSISSTPSLQYPTKNNASTSTSISISTLSTKHNKRSLILSASKNSNNNNNNNNNSDSNKNEIDKNNKDKFSFYQRIESAKTAALGALSGGLLSAPFIGFHDLPSTNGLAQWEFDTDMGSLESALFAIVYRYCAREDDDNDMLNMGVVGAFVLTRTLSRIRVPSYCTAVPLDCGDPLGYFDYDMIRQLLSNGLESAALFGGAALAMEYAYREKWIGKFPN